MTWINFTGHVSAINDIAVNGDLIATAGDDCAIRMFRWPKPKAVRLYGTFNRRPITHLRFITDLEDQDFLIASAGTTIFAFRFDAENESRVIIPNYDKIFDIMSEKEGDNEVNWFDFEPKADLLVCVNDFAEISLFAFGLGTCLAK